MTLKSSGVSHTKYTGVTEAKRNTAAKPAARPRARSSRDEVSICERQVERQQQRVKHQEPVCPEQPDERRREERIDVRLPVVEAAPARDPASAPS